MQMFNIHNAIKKYLSCEDKKKIAIYPYGNMGIQTKKILNSEFGIKEAVIVDNRLSEVYPQIKSLNEIENHNEYVWILTCSNPEFHKSIVTSICDLVPQDQIIDIFEETPIYSKKYKMLSRIGTKLGETISTPCWEFLQLIEKKKRENRIISIAEVGIGIGATSVEACKKLSPNDTYYCFDFHDAIDDLLHDLKELPEICCKIVGKKNTHKICDSYNWNLSEMIFDMRNENKNGMFDVVFLDGAHTFAHDGLACCLLKELLKPNGYIVFDDMNWTCRKSGGEEMCNDLKDLYTEEQLCDRQVLRVVNAFMIEDRRFQQIYMGGGYIKSCQSCIHEELLKPQSS